MLARRWLAVVGTASAVGICVVAALAVLGLVARGDDAPSAHAEDTQILAIDARTGDILWNVAGPTKNVYIVMAGGGHLVVGGSDECETNRAVTTFVSFDLLTGEEKWSRTDSLSLECPGALSSAQTDENGVGVLTRGGVGKDGAPVSILQGIDTATGSISWSLVRDPFGTVLVGPDAAVYAARAARVQLESITAIDKADGNVLWSSPLVGQEGRSEFPAAIDAGTLYIVEGVPASGASSGFVLRALSLTDGAEKWRFPFEGFFFKGAPTVVGGRAFLMLPGAAMNTGVPVNSIVALEAATGRELWRGSGGLLGACADSVLLIPHSGAGEMILLDAGTGAEKWRRPFPTDSISTHVLPGCHILVWHAELLSSISPGTGDILWGMPFPPGREVLAAAVDDKLYITAGQTR